MTKTEEIKCFAITQTFHTNKGTSAFAGHIYASSFAEAEQLAKQIGAKLDGEMVESVCFKCGEKEVFNNSDETPWIEEFEDD